MKIFLSYGHDSNAPLIEKIKEYLSTDTEGNLKHEVWIDTSEIKAGKNWREKITKGVLESDVVLAGLSEHSTRIPGVCRDEISISIGVKGGNIRTILLEPSDVVAPPAMISHIQWLDMSDWKEHEKEGFESEYFQEKFRQIAEMIETPENEEFEGEITTLRNYLEPISSIGRIKYLTQSHLYGRRWIVDKIQEWDKSSDQRVFWIMAGPGYGKSTFSANFQLLYNSRIPAIHFVEWGKPHHYDPSTILRNLAFQLAVRYPEYRKILLAMPKDTLPQLKYKSEDELFQILFCDNTWCVIDGGRENAWILMDALDEASDENGNKIAETVARHLDQMPSWIRFIITSRHDPYVKNVFKRFHPQVLDLEKNASDHNLEDMSMYLNAEMNGTDVSDGVKNELLKKSNGVFLYLKLCVEAYKAGELDLSGNSELPNSLSDFYYLTFMRIFRDRIEHYRNRVLPILEVMVGSKEAVSIPFAQYCSELRNDYDFFDALREIEIICRMGRQKDDTVRTISFFHQSLKDWLLNHDSSGPFYVSLVQAEKRISRCLSRWLVSEDKNDSSYWSINGFGICHLKGIDIDRIGSISQKKVHLIMDSIHIDCAFGGMLKTHNYEVNILLDYVDSMAHNKSNTTSVLEFLNVLFESVKDKYIIRLHMEKVMSASLELHRPKKGNKKRVMISYRNSCGKEVELFRKREETKRGVEIKVLPPGSLCDDYEAHTPMRRWMLVGLLEDHIRSVDEVWVYYNSIYTNSWWTLAEMVMVAYINHDRAEKDKVKVKVYDAGKKRFIEEDEDGYPAYLHVQLSDSQHRKLARYLSNTNSSTMGPETLRQIDGLKQMADMMQSLDEEEIAVIVEQMRPMIEQGVPSGLPPEDRDKMVNDLLSMYSDPKALMAYANDPVFKDEFWNNISYQTERVTAAFKDGTIDVDTFMETPMQELTKFKDVNLRTAANSNLQIDLRNKKYYVGEGKKRYLWLATRMGMPTAKYAPGIEIVQTYNLLAHG